MQREAVKLEVNPYPAKGVRALEILWQQTVPRVFDINFTKPFTMKDRGMLKRFINFVAPHDAHKILNFVLNDWSGYCSYTVDSAGLKVSPQYPSIPFLLKYCGEATNYMLHGKQQAQVTLIAPDAKVTPPTHAKVYEPEEGGQASLKDLEEIEKLYGL